TVAASAEVSSAMAQRHPSVDRLVLFRSETDPFRNYPRHCSALEPHSSTFPFLRTRETIVLIRPSGDAYGASRLQETRHMNESSAMRTAGSTGTLTLYGGTGTGRRVTVTDLAKAKARGERWPMLTAYDAVIASVFDEAGIPVLLVGDSAGN